MATTITTGVQYSGLWTRGQQMQAVAAGSWPQSFKYSLYAWGGNSNGSLGLGNTNSYSSPKLVGSLTTWSNIAVTYTASIAVKLDGTLWSWGSNVYGELGLGNTTSYSSPKQVGALTNWATCAGGTGFVAAIKTDGTIWAWGKNNYSQSFIPFGQNINSDWSAVIPATSVATKGMNNVFSVSAKANRSLTFVKRYTDTTLLDSKFGKSPRFAFSWGEESFITKYMLQHWYGKKIYYFRPKCKVSKVYLQ